MNTSRSLPMQGAELPSGKALDYGTNPEHMGHLVHPEGHARITGPCGDTDEIFLRIREGKITEARFTTDGCLFTRAACNAATHLAVGRSVAECLCIDQQTILEHLNGLPESHVHCALLAATTLSAAVENYEGCAKPSTDGIRTNEAC